MLKEMREKTASLEKAFIDRAGPVAGRHLAKYKKESAVASAACTP